MYAALERRRDLFQCWVRYHVGFILLSCIYVDVCLWNVNQYYRKKNINPGSKVNLSMIIWVRKKLQNSPDLSFFLKKVN